MSLKVRPFRGKFEVDIHYYDRQGKRVRERRVAPVASRSAALRWGQALQRELLLGELSVEAERDEPQRAPDTPTLAQFAPRFISDYCVANRQKASTISGKRSMLDIHLLPMLGKKRLDEIGNHDVQCMKRALAKKSPSTVNNVLSVLSKLLKVAVEWGVLETMPCTIKLLRRPQPEMAFLEFDEYARLLDAADEVGGPARLIVLLGGDAGLRLGEMLALKWTDVDMERRQIKVCRSDWNGHVDVPKGGRSRVVPMTDRLAKEIAAQRHLRGQLVLCQRRGRPLTDRLLQGFAARSARLANLEHRGVHILRHTFCSHLAMRGVPARSIQALAGHRNLTTTERYLHLSPRAIEDAIRLLEQPRATQRAAFR